MREIGAYLRRVREEKGLTLEQIQAGTKIRQAYLRAIEEGDFAVIPGEVYVRGFLQNYASAVGLDPAEVLGLYDQKRKSAEPVPDESQPIQAVESRRAFSWRQAAITGVAMLGLAGAVFLIRGIHPDAGARPVQTARQQTEAAAAKEMAPKAKPEIQTPADGVHLVLRFQARCWLLVRIDGRIKFEGTLNPGAIQEWQADQVIRIQFGNAGGVEAVLNGRSLGVLGSTGQNLEREFRASDQKNAD